RLVSPDGVPRLVHRRSPLGPVRADDGDHRDAGGEHGVLRDLWLAHLGALLDPPPSWSPLRIQRGGGLAGALGRADRGGRATGARLGAGRPVALGIRRGRGGPVVVRPGARRDESGPALRAVGLGVLPSRGRRSDRPHLDHLASPAPGEPPPRWRSRLTPPAPPATGGRSGGAGRS